MSIEVKESSMIKPSEETPRGKLWLSRLDMIVRSPNAHTRVLLVYTPKMANNSSTSFFDMEIMKETLGRALVAFYPMAGRVTMNEEEDRYEIDCNAEGALFVEAKASHTIADLDDQKIRKAMSPECDYSKGLSSFPLLMVQVTRLKCGSVCIGFAQHHHVADGASHAHFINSWARLARGLDIGVIPIHDRYKYLAPRQPPKVDFHHSEYDPPLPLLTPKDSYGVIEDTVERVFKLTKDQINGLKQEALSKSEKVLTTFEVLGGHVWKSASKARGLQDDQEIKLYVRTDARSRLKNPTIPQGYCGNLIFQTSCGAKAKDIVHKEVWEVGNMIHEELRKKNDNGYLRSAIDYVETMPNWKSLIRGPHSVGCPNLFINSWARIPSDEVDFGWGKPSYMRRREIRHEGQSYIVPSDNRDGGLLVCIRLYTSHMIRFEKYFYDLGTKIHECDQIGPQPRPIHKRSQVPAKL